MTARLIRICLAFAVAFVFIGRMEAAAEHCARLVAEEQAAAGPQHDDAPCHGAEAAEDAPQHMSHPPAPQDPLQSQCECIAVLAGFASFAPPLASVRVEPYEWIRPPATAFASIEPAIALRPPRA